MKREIYSDPEPLPSSPGCPCCPFLHLIPYVLTVVAIQVCCCGSCKGSLVIISYYIVKTKTKKNRPSRAQ